MTNIKFSSFILSTDARYPTSCLLLKTFTLTLRVAQRRPQPYHTRVEGQLHCCSRETLTGGGGVGGGGGGGVGGEVGGGGGGGGGEVGGGAGVRRPSV